jgi:hypothetical protein
MAARIWLKFGSIAQEGWQSVLQEIKLKNSIKKFYDFLGIFF